MVTQLSTVVTGMDCTPSLRSGHNIFCMPSMPFIMDAFMSCGSAVPLCMSPMGMLADGAIVGVVCA